MDLFHTETTLLMIQIPEGIIILMDHLESLLHINSQVFHCYSDAFPGFL